MKLSYTLKEAIAATGASRDTLLRAINAGDLAVLDPRVEGQPLRVKLIAAEELNRWLRNEERK